MAEVRYEGVEQQFLRGVPVAIVLLIFAGLACCLVENETLRWVAAVLAVASVATFWWFILAPVEHIRVVGTDYIATGRRGSSTFDLCGVTDLKYEWIPYSGGQLTIVSGSGGMTLPRTRRRRQKFIAIGEAIREAQPRRMFSDVRAMRILEMRL